ncbi:MFS transporter [Zooshikella marina]|uniref:MFS transporter n=1 Tax=Zooshikella ganghwensis TaxID=202772 RepID=UPI001BB08671|nr:MFS transporter [Zooshikella ganghwensis]MBU2706015.1 MFS transporter [Zooshikella ganghwensis]
MISWKRRLGIVAGNTFEYYDIAVYASISTYIAVNFFPESTENSLLFVWGIFALRFLMRPIGGLVMGMYSDKHGRKPALIFTSALIGAATLMLACLPTYQHIGLLAPCALLLLQMMQSFCFGGEYPVIISYLLDNAYPNEKARVSSLIVSSSLLGVIISLVVTFILEYQLTAEEMTSWGWRVPLALGVLNIIISFYFKLKLTDKVPLEANHKTFKLDMHSIVKVFLVAIPAGIIFYVNATCSNTLVKLIADSSELKALYALLNNTILVLLFLVVGYAVDKHWSTQKAMTMGIYGLIVFSPVLYMMLDSTDISMLILAQSCILIISALILSPTCAVLFNQTTALNRTTSLALGYNIALSIFGGLTPLVITSLSTFNPVFTGLVIGATGFTYLFATKIMGSSRVLDHNFRTEQELISN